MKIYAISDFHLSLNGDKPMDRFGDNWNNHHLTLEQNFQEHVQEDDLILLPGDHSWGLRLGDAQEDLEFIQQLPGIKLLSKGNHDYWWTGLTKMSNLFPGLYFIHNNCWIQEDLGVAGTRGWDLPTKDSTEKDLNLFQRELGRLRLSLEQIPSSCSRRIAMLHYPPLTTKHKDTPVVELLSEFEIDCCVYGHLHLNAEQTIQPKPFEGVHRGIDFHLVSCDYLNFQPKSIPL